MGFSGIRTQIVGIEGEHADHLTTTTALQTDMLKFDIFWLLLTFAEPNDKKVLKVCNEGFMLNNGEKFLEVVCDVVKGVWSLPDGKEIPKYKMIFLWKILHSGNEAN